MSLILIAGLIGAVVVRPSKLGRLAAGQPGIVVPASAQRTAAARSFRMTVGVSLPPFAVRGASGSLTIRGDGAYDMLAHRGYLTARASGPGVPQKQANLDEEIVFAPDAAYIRVMSAPPGGKSWIKQPAPIGPVSAYQMDPELTLGALRRDASNVRRAGTATIDGAATARYTLILAGSATGAGPPRQLPAEVWIDAAGRVRQLRLTADLAVPAVGPQPKLSRPKLDTRITFTMKFSEFGITVADRTPPPDQVFDSAPTAEIGGPAVPPACQQQANQVLAGGDHPDSASLGKAIQSTASACSTP